MGAQIRAVVGHCCAALGKNNAEVVQGGRGTTWYEMRTPQRSILRKGKGHNMQPHTRPVAGRTISCELSSAGIDRNTVWYWCIAALTTTISTFKIEDSSRGPGRVDFRAPDGGLRLNGAPEPKIQRDPSPQTGILIRGPPLYIGASLNQDEVVIHSLCPKTHRT